VLRFELAAGHPPPPFAVTATWHGKRKGQPTAQRIDVAGHREIRFRPFDSTRDHVTKYESFDEHLLRTLDQMAAASFAHDQLQAFGRLLGSISRVSLEMTWDRRYRLGSRITERQFHDDLFAALGDDPELSGRVERGAPTGLGYLDIRHDGITAKLKCERTSPADQKSAQRYVNQTVQYSADGARLSILCILDMTNKQSTVGTPENYLFTPTPDLHGLSQARWGSIVAVLIVNGNLPSPSSWSRRKR
jgi:hypothetical protein